MRIEKQFKKYNVTHFEFDTGLIGVDELYKKDFDEIIEQCMDRLEPNNDKLPIKLIRKALIVNRENHVQP